MQKRNRAVGQRGPWGDWLNQERSRAYRSDQEHIESDQEDAENEIKRSVKEDLEAAGSVRSDQEDKEAIRSIIKLLCFSFDFLRFWLVFPRFFPELFVVFFLFFSIVSLNFSSAFLYGSYMFLIFHTYFLICSCFFFLVFLLFLGRKSSQVHVLIRFDDSVWIIFLHRHLVAYSIDTVKPMSPVHWAVCALF